MNAIRISFVLAMALAFSAIPARAGSITYDLAFSGASFGDSAVGVGTVTIDTSLLNNPARQTLQVHHSSTRSQSRSQERPRATGPLAWPTIPAFFSTRTMPS
jgi:hypothetical protein